MASQVWKGLGQLEAYIGAEEGVAFQMENSMFWDSLGSGLHWTVEGVPVKKTSSKFLLIPATSGRVMMKNWLGLYLAAVEVQAEEKTFPIQPVQYSKKQSLRFEVFFRDNLVAFRAYNGLFLARTFRGFNFLEAAKFFPDDTCCFLPQVGDIALPMLEIRRVIPNDFFWIHYRQYFVDKKIFYNRTMISTQYDFRLTWVSNTIDRVFWNRLWGLGMPSSCPFQIEDAVLRVRYTESNDHSLSMVRPVVETVVKQVDVPPNTKAVARLWVDKQNNAAIPFTAVVRKTKPSGVVKRFSEKGAWKGMVYRNLRIEVTMEPILGGCVAM